MPPQPPPSLLPKFSRSPSLPCEPHRFAHLEFHLYSNGPDETRQLTPNRGHHLPLALRSLRVAGAVFVVIIVIFFAVAFVVLFVFFLVKLLSKEDIGRYRPIRKD